MSAIIQLACISIRSSTRIRPALLSCFAVALASCTTIRTPVTAERAASPKPGEGFVTATFAAKGLDHNGKDVTPCRNVTLMAKGTGSNRSVLVNITPQVYRREQSPWIPLEGFGGTRPSDELAIPLPEGDYEITGWSVRTWGMTAEVIFSNRLPMKVPFHVKAGETTYLGRINSLCILGKNLIGIPVPAAALVLMKDEYANDVPRITKSYPSIKRSSIKHSNVPKLYMDEMKRIADTPPKFLGLF
jgi:hypothetical protein